jgi:GT2 family glycosyltransferase
LIIDQSDNNQVKEVIKNINSPIIRYFNIKKNGLSFARNYGISIARGEILAFTDDDCLPVNNWLKEIIDSFRQYKEVVAVFGKTLPYEPRKHIGLICPCVFRKGKKNFITKPCRHWINIGFGNNMAFRKEIFTSVGTFKNWLSVGSLGKSAEDAEFALRVLIKGYKLMYNPKMIVYHNKWLTPKQADKQNLSYICGEMACYNYFASQGYNFATTVVVDNWKDTYLKIKKICKRILTMKWNFVTFILLIQTILQFFYRSRGFLIGKYYTLTDPLQ